MELHRIILLIVLITVICSCDKKDALEPGYDCEAVVIGDPIDQGVFCNKKVLNLKVIKGEDRIKSLFDYDYNVTNHEYPFLNLPDELSVDGLILKLKIRLPEYGELPGCLNFEMPIELGPTIYVIRAEKK